MIAFIDLETDGLYDTCTRIWTAVAYLEEEQEYVIYPSDNINTVEAWLDRIKGYTLVAHNGIAFDFRVLNKLFGFKYDLDCVIDTLVTSRCLYPDREGHSLKWWGIKLGKHKGDYTDWSKFTPEMLEYCINDVDVLRRVYFSLEEEKGDWPWDECLRLESRIADIMARQESKGVLFDSNKAKELLSSIETELADIEQKVYNEVPKKAVQVGATVTKPFLKTGGYTKQVQEWINQTL